MFSFLQIEIIYEHQNWGVGGVWASLSGNMWSRCATQEVQSIISSNLYLVLRNCHPMHCNGWIGMDCAFPRDHFSVSFVCSPTEVIWASYSKIYNFGNGRLILFIYNFQCLRLCLCVTLSLSSCWSCHVSSTFWSIVRYIILDTIYHKYRAFFYL